MRPSSSSSELRHSSPPLFLWLCISVCLTSLHISSDMGSSSLSAQLNQASAARVENLVLLPAATALPGPDRGQARHPLRTRTKTDGGGTGSGGVTCQLPGPRRDGRSALTCPLHRHRTPAPQRRPEKAAVLASLAMAAGGPGGCCWAAGERERDVKWARSRVSAAAIDPGPARRC